MRKLIKKLGEYIIYKGVLLYIKKSKQNPITITIKSDCSEGLARRLFEKGGYSCRFKPLKEVPGYDEFIINY